MKVKLNFKRFLAFVLVMVMVCAYIPAGAFAAEGEAPAQPTATVTEIKKDDLTFAMNFLADAVTDEQLAYYGDWYADFELTVNKKVTFNANGGADGYLSGQYDAWSENWVNVPFENVTLEADKPLKIMEYASKLMGKTGLKYTYGEVYNAVKDFDCGVYFEPAFLKANSDLVVTLELKMYDPDNQTEGYVIGDTYIFDTTEIFVAQNVQTGKNYNNVATALEEAAADETVQLLNRAKAQIVYVLEDTTLDLNGFELEADYMVCFGNIIDGSAANTGRLNVDAKHFLTQKENVQLPVNTDEGYMFVDVTKFNKAYLADKNLFVFQPFVEAFAHSALMAGKEASGVSVEVEISWKNAANNGVRSQNFVFNDDTVQTYLNSYNAGTGKYGKTFMLTLVGAENLQDLQFRVVLRSKTDVAFYSDSEKVNMPAKPEEQTLTSQDGNNSAVVPEGVLMENGATKLTLTTTEMESSQGNILVGDDESLRSMDVHVEGLSADNTVPLIVTLNMFAPEALNQGNLTLYHVENGETKAMTRVNALADVKNHNEFYYDIETGSVTMALATFSEIAALSNDVNQWNGEFDYSWYDPDATALTIANADQLAAFGAIVGGMAKDDEGNYIVTTTDSEGNEYHNDSFAGKTVKLINDISIGDVTDEDGRNIMFYPIGYWNNTGSYEKKPGNPDGVAVSSGFYAFEGTFDGNGHTISDFYQNTWEAFGDYNDGYSGTPNHYRDGFGLFGRINKGTVKNLIVKNFSSDGEYTTTGVIAAYAEGATFENIAIFNCNPRVYNIGNGGIVGCVGWYAKEAGLKTTLKNITVDNSNKISALWGSWDVACGGLIGQYYPTSGQTSAGTPKNGGIEMENCHVSAQIDVYNDVCANYQYYAYRYAGMLIGSVRENVTIDGHVYPKMDDITAKDCTVHFGDWNDYYYCELVANSLASYTHDHQMSRLVQVLAVNGTTITSLEGESFEVPSSGRYNYVVVKTQDENGMWIHGDGEEYATCYHFVDGEVWNHADAGTETVNGVDGVLKEDKQCIYREFNNLVTGYGWGVTSRGFENLDGVTNLDVEHTENEESVVKFKCIADISYEADVAINIGELFEATEAGLNAETAIQNSNVQVTVSPVGENSTADGEYVANTTDWTQGTLTFSGKGVVSITITDYYFCTPTTILVVIGGIENTAAWA